MPGLLILGAGGHGRVVSDVASLAGKWDDIAFLDDNENLKEVIGFPVVGKLKDYINMKEKYEYAFVAIGKNPLRLEWIEKLEKVGFIIPNIIHPQSVISRLSSIGLGSVIMAGAVVNTCAVIGKGCILNTFCSVDYDCILDEGVHISPGAHLGGTAKVGKCTWVCIGASVANNITIGSNVVVAAGAVVIRDIEDNSMAAGVPAKIKKAI
jgi:sugar O-acyltransferase (sialic acid O-acetyltransferase NeuD family)